MLAGTGLLGLIGHILFNRNCKKIETNLREFKIQTFGPFLQNLFCAKPKDFVIIYFKTGLWRPHLAE